MIIEHSFHSYKGFHNRLGMILK